MEMRDMNVQEANPPLKGDLVQVIDNSFPKAQYLVLGQITDISPRRDQPLRYSIRITPRVAITSLHRVMILVK
jgi:hypothetical protein